MAFFRCHKCSLVPLWSTYTAILYPIHKFKKWVCNANKHPCDIYNIRMTMPRIMWVYSKYLQQSAFLCWQCSVQSIVHTLTTFYGIVLLTMTWWGCLFEKTQGIQAYFWIFPYTTHRTAQTKKKDFITAEWSKVQATSVECLNEEACGALLAIYCILNYT